MSMSTAKGRAVAAVLAGLAISLFVSGAVRAGDALKDAEARRKVEAQRAERDIRDARDKALQQARDNPAGAKRRIDDLIALVESNEDFTDNQRANLVTLLKRDLADIEKIAADARAVDATRPPRTTGGPDDNKAATDAAKDVIGDRRDVVKHQREFRDEQGKRFTLTIDAVFESALPPKYDYEFPKNWVELSKRRAKSSSLMTDTERAIMEALDKPMAVDLKDVKFNGVMDYFQKQTGQTIILDKESLESAGVTNETTVSLQLPAKVATKTALKKVLADVGLVYVVKDETIQVMTPAKAREIVTTRTYYIGDVVGGADLRLGSLGRFQALQAINDLVVMITQIEPDSWEVNGNGGKGKISFNPVTMTLSITQTAEMHYKIGGGGNK
jgi:hypothetical protein